MTTIRNIRCVVLLLATVGGAAVAAAAAPDGETTAVLSKLHQSNQKEIEMGKLAQKNGQSREIKAFGQMLEKDHSAADKKVMALANDEKVTLPESAGMKDDMGSISQGPDFDLKFAQAMLDDHKKDIAEANQARDATTDKKLKKLLTDLIPTLQKHEQTAQKIVDGRSKSASR